MYKKILFLFALLLITVVGAKADGITATTADIGKVICEDGSIYDNDEYAYLDGKTAVAMIAYVDNTNNVGLAIAMISIQGNAQTLAAAKAYAEGLTSVPGGTWVLPTVDQWKLALKGFGADINNEPIDYSGIVDKIKDGLHLGGYTWASTLDPDDENYVYNAYFDEWSGGYQAKFQIVSATEEEYALPVRAFLTFEPGTSSSSQAISTADIGKVLCTDFSVYATKSEAVADSKTPAAMIAYVDEINKKGLAIALEDNPTQSDWNDAKTAISAFAPVSHSTWKMPTIDEWKQILTGCGDAEPPYTIDAWTHSEIDAKLTAAEGSPLTANGNGYWSDDVVTYSGEDYIKIVDVNTEHVVFNSSSGVPDYPYNSTRACLAFDIVTATPHTISIDPSLDGIASASLTEAAEGEIFTVTVTAPAGQIATNAVISDEDYTDYYPISGGWYNGGTFFFAMPDKDVVVSGVEFTEESKLTENGYPQIYIGSGISDTGTIPETVETFTVEFTSNNVTGLDAETLTLTAPAGKMLRVQKGVITKMDANAKLTIKDASDSQLYLHSSSSAVVDEETFYANGDLGTVDLADETLTIETKVPLGSGSNITQFSLTLVVFDPTTLHTITIQDAEHGTVRNHASDYATTGEAVRLTVYPDAGYMVDHLIIKSPDDRYVWCVSDLKGGTWYTSEKGAYSTQATFVMPDFDVVVKPTFTSAKRAAKHINREDWDGLFAKMNTFGTVYATIPEGIASFQVVDESVGHNGFGGSMNPTFDSKLILTAPSNSILQLSGEMYVPTWGGGRGITICDGTSSEDNELITFHGDKTTGGWQKIPTTATTGNTMYINFYSTNVRDSNYGLRNVVVSVVPTYFGSGTYEPITEEDEVTLPEITVSYHWAGPAQGEKPDAVIDSKNVYLYTTCTPWAPPTSSNTRYYTLSSGSESSLQFSEIIGDPQPFTPYLVAVFDNINNSIHSTGVTLSKENGCQETGNYKFIGTTIGISNEDAAANNVYILQEGNVWGKVTTENPEAFIPPFRAFIVPTSTNSKEFLANSFTNNGDDPTAIRTMQLIDSDGTSHWFDLNGRPISEPNMKGVYIKNGQKVTVK